ncbi:MAG TPA: SDR family NAD(P)-dependent oxidoreductase [Bacteroidia bacterium]|nr:SDR family NAD(P)-dependent oxidoreductase [Bacteroidia bacterium]
MQEKNFYSNKVVLITGSSMGIGKELAHQVLLRGGKVFLTARNKSKLMETAAEFKQYQNAVRFMNCDVSDYSGNVLLIQEVIESFGKLDVLITNAGMSCYGEVEATDVNVAKEVIDTNIYGSLFPVMAAMGELKKSKGSITFISSIAGLSGLPGYSAYSLSKMALTALAQSLLIELKSHHVNVQIAYVGFTENEKSKITLAPNGMKEKVPERPKLLTSSRSHTAKMILRQTEKGKFSKTYSIVGVITASLSKYFPSIVRYSLGKNYERRSFKT